MPVGELEYDGCVRIPLFLSSWPTGKLGVVGKEVQRDHSICLDVEGEGKIGAGMLRRYGGAGDESMTSWVDPRSPIHSNSPKD